MKFISAFIPLLSLPLVSSKAVNPGVIVIPKPYIISDIIEAIKNKTNFYYDIDLYDVNKNDILSIDIVDKKTSESISSRTYTLNPTDTVEGKKHQKMSLEFPADHLTSNGMNITYKIRRLNSDLYNKTATIYPREEESIDLDGSTKSLSRSSYYYMLDGSSISSSESYNFLGFGNTFSNSPNNYLSFEGLTFYTAPGKNVVRERSGNYLTFIDTYNLFPYIEKNNDYAIIPISTTRNNGTFGLTFNHQMYVNPKTLQMSSLFHPGFMETNHFYMPLRNRELLEEYEYTLYLNNVGFSKTHFTKKLYYSDEYQIFGTCDSSSYCIGGGVNS